MYTEFLYVLYFNRDLLCISYWKQFVFDCHFYPELHVRTQVALLIIPHLIKTVRFIDSSCVGPIFTHHIKLLIKCSWHPSLDLNCFYQIAY